MVANSVLSGALVLCVCLVCSQVPAAYMDEEFHVPQLDRYLRGNFAEWDPKITTFPGMYIATWLLCRLTPVLWVFDLVTVCRIYSAAVSLCCLWLLRRLSPSAAELAWLFPPLFASYSIYYTDATALCSVLAHCWLLRQGKVALAGAVSTKQTAVAAVLCRQTNIVWVGFAVACRVADRYEGKSHFQTILNIAKNWQAIAQLYAVHLGVLGAFAVFVAANGGVVVGDREHHVPVLHLSQLLYLALVFAVYLPLSKNAAKQTLLSLFEAASIVLAGALLVFLELGWYEHPFLLADNRHYTFYIWKYLLKPYKLHLLPAYLLSVLYLGHYHNDAVKFAAWMICAAATVVPAQLLEPRYFIQPIVLFLVAFPCESVSRLRVYSLLALNLSLAFVFALKPYKSIHFMW